MGTTSQKLTYLNTTKQLLKTEINKINNVLDDNSTFRSYPQELFNGYLDILNNGTDMLWNNLEKVSASGETPVLENVETAPIKTVLNGNTSQETTSGKNLLDFKNPEKVGWIIYVDNPLKNFSSGKYSIACVNSYITSGKGVGISFANENKERVGIYLTGYDFGNTKMSYENRDVTDVEINAKYMLFNPQDNLGTVDILKAMNIQLEQGSTATSYEPYTGGQPSPSPDFPQEVKVVKGENVVSVSGKNLCNIVERTQVTYPNSTPVINDFNNKIIKGINYAGYSRSSDATYTTTTSSINVTTNNNANYGVGLTFKLKQGNYYLSFNTSSSYGKVAILNYNDNGVYQSNTQHSSSFSFTISSYTNIIIVFYNDTVNQSCEFTNIQLEQGSTATDFVPYSKTDYPINLGDIELCKINTYKDYFHKDSGKWYVHKEINKIVLNGSENWADRQQGSATYLYLKCTLQNGANGGISNIFKYNQSYNAPEEHILVDHYWKEASIVIRKDRLSTPNVANFKTWLSNNNVTLYYVLATPTETEITNTTLISQLEAISKAKSVKDKTYITQTNEELPFILDVEAIKEYEVN